MIFEYCLLLISLICIIFSIWAKWKLTYWQRRGVPTLPTNLLFGNFKDFIYQRISPGFLIGRLHLEADAKLPFIGIYVLHQPFLILRDPKLIKQIFVKDFDVFSNRYFAAKNPRDPMGTRNLFSIDNPEWRYLRHKLSPAFSSKKVKQLFKLVVESSGSLENYLNDQFKNNPDGKITVDIKEAGSRYVTDIISSVAFGVKTNSFDIPSPEFYERGRKPFDMPLGRLIRFFCVFFYPQLSKLFSGTLLEEGTDFFREVFWSSMEEREKSKSARGDVIDNLLELKNEEQDAAFHFDGDDLVAQSVIFFIAGLETSAVTISLGLYELAKHPEIQDRVRAEIREKLRDGGMKYETIQEMKYLMQVINETLRMYPPAPLLDRVAERDYRIPDTNVIIEKGTAVYAALPGIQMDPKYFPNPEIFDPDRFSDERKNEIQPFTFMPFGDGPRICIGMRVGKLQTAVGFIKILQNYEVSINPAYKTQLNPRNIFIQPLNGVHLYVKKIKA